MFWFSQVFQRRWRVSLKLTVLAKWILHFWFWFLFGGHLFLEKTIFLFSLFKRHFGSYFGFSKSKLEIFLGILVIEGVVFFHIFKKRWCKRFSVIIFDPCSGNKSIETSEKLDMTFSICFIIIINPYWRNGIWIVIYKRKFRNNYVGLIFDLVLAVFLSFCTILLVFQNFAMEK